MHDESIFQEAVVRFEPPAHHYTLIMAPDGGYLGVDDEGETATFGHVDDKSLWDATGDETFEHVTSGLAVRVEDGAVSVDGGGTLDAEGRLGPSTEFRVVRGPEEMPSVSLTHFKAHGWVCLNSILAPDLVEALEQVACTDRYAHLEPDRSQSPLCQSSAIARAAAEPVSLWLIRRYMQTEDICTAHPPGLAVLDEDDGERVVQGWHADYPYHWGVPAVGRVPTASGETVLGVQRNVCISPFTKVGGATAFKLGSHAEDRPPPEAWGVASDHYKPGYREMHGLPYTGPDADVIEAPGGTIILYDARTWHRAGINRTPNRRAALLQAMTPMYVVPKNDTSGAYRELLECEAYGELTDRERDELERLMLHRFIGPGGRYAFSADRDLTESVRAKVQVG